MPDRAPAGQLFVTTNYGLLVVDQGSAQVELICDELALEQPDAQAHFAATGEILTAGFKGVRVSTDGGCTFDEVQIGGADRVVQDIQTLADRRLAVATASGTAGSDVFVSSDGGATWTALGAPSRDIFLASVRSVGAEAYPVAATGLKAESGEGMALWQAGDGTWQAHVIESFDSAQMGQPRIADCHPTEPRCLVFGDADEELNRLLEIHPDGSSIVVEEGFASAIVDATYSATGALLVAHFEGELLRLPSSTPVGEAEADAWVEQSIPASSTCIVRQGAFLYLCGNPFIVDSFLVGRSADEGESWESIVPSFKALSGPIDCPEGTPHEAICPAIWEEVTLLFGIGEDVFVPGDPSAEGSEDGSEEGAGDEGSEPGESGVEPGEDGEESTNPDVSGSGSSGCRSPVGPHSSWPWGAVFLVLAWTRRPRRDKCVLERP